MHHSAEFDIIIYGATGYTGRLVAEHLISRHGGRDGLRVALAGRSADKLEALRDEMAAPKDTPLLVADAGDSASLNALVRRARAVLTCVGPYQLHGEPLLAACVAQGTDYLDLCGEPNWMRSMIDAYEIQAKRSGARVIFSAGFDCIPFETGIFFLQETARALLGTTVPRAKGRVRKVEGGVSGGTLASIQASMVSAATDPKVYALLNDPFSLTPGFTGATQPVGKPVELDSDLDAWVTPFMLSYMNIPNIHRCNALLDHAWGRDFVYDEMLVTGPGAPGEAAATAIAANHGNLVTGDLPKPGEGPSKEVREKGSYDVLHIGFAPDGRQVRVSVSADEDPYGSTSKMVGEAVTCLINECSSVPGGFWTPSSGMGQRLIARLTKHAGMRFTVER